MLSQKTLIAQVVNQKKICKRKNELKSSVRTGQLLPERKTEVRDGKRLLPSRYLVITLIILEKDPERANVRVKMDLAMVPVTGQLIKSVTVTMVLTAANMDGALTIPIFWMRKWRPKKVQ